MNGKLQNQALLRRPGVIKMKKILIILVLSILITGCSFHKFISKSDPEVLIKSDFDKRAFIAVLSFTKRGTSQGGEWGRIIADKLSEKMFLSDSFHIVERSRVNEAVKYFEVKSPEELSLDAIQKLGLRLKANYILIGNVTLEEKDQYLSDDKKKNIYINFRIISSLNSEITVVVNYKMENTDDLKEQMDEMLNKIVEKLAIM